MRKQERGKTRRLYLRRISTLLGAIVVFVTTYSLILPAITMETKTFCGEAEHVHGSECYTPVLICNRQEEGEITLLSAPSVRTEATLTCGLAEHTHTSECYDGEGNLTCDREEHVHSDDCYESRKVESTPENHVHTEACYEYVLTCQQTEHTHSLQCYSDPEADTDPAPWEEKADKALSELPEEGRDVSARVTAVARALEGYTASEKNYFVAEDGVRGYTLFGGAYGAPYAPWNALFADWVLQRAQVSGYPLGPDADSWVTSLLQSDTDSGTAYLKYADPRPGDLVFIRSPQASEDVRYADRVAIVDSVTTQGLYAWEGDCDGRVSVSYYGFDEGKIAAYGVLPPDPVPETVTEMAETPEETAAPVPETPEETAAPVPETPAVTEAPSVIETPAAAETPEAPASAGTAEPLPESGDEALAPPPLEPDYEEIPEQETPRVYYSQEDQADIAFPEADPAADAPEKTVKPSHETPVTADPDMIAALREIETGKTEKKSVLRAFLDLMGGLFGSRNNTLTAAAGTVTVTATFEKGVLPEGAAMVVAPVEGTDYETLVSQTTGRRVVELIPLDISFLDGNRVVEPEGEVQVTFSLEDRAGAGEETGLDVIHIEHSGEATVLDSDASADEITVTTDSFSVYIVSYTVDFHFGLDGQTYDLSIPGGGCISFGELAEALGLPEKEPEADIQSFLGSVSSITFSDPDLLCVAPVTEDTTLGALKAQLNLNCQYASDLTEEAIAAMDARELRAGDWALISLLPFDTEETLTVTMADGDVFTILVTDDRDTLGLDGRTFSILTKKGGNTGHSLQASVHANRDNRGYYLGSLDVNLNDETQYAYRDGVYYVRQDATAWTFEYNATEQAYYISNNGKYLYLDPNITTKNNSQDHSLNLVDSKSAASKFKITKNEDGSYLIGNDQGTLIWDYGNGYWLSNPADEGGNTTDGKIWLCIPENPNGSHKATLTAAKDLSNGQTVVIYQKKWNNVTDQYDFYAIDGNGVLQKVWDSSDSLYWKDASLSIQWTLTEQTDSQGNPTGYLLLYNPVTKTYLAPKSDNSSGSGYTVVTSETALTEDTMKTVSVSLPGRDNGAYGSRIATWDYADNTTYGISMNRQIDTTGQTTGYTLGVTELLSSEEFLFAVRDPVVQRQLTTVDTVDSAAKGINIKMFDFNDSTNKTNGRLDYMTYVMGHQNWKQGEYPRGIMSRTLGDDGFPVSVKDGNNGNQSLRKVFYPEADANNNKYHNYTSTLKANNANHLFLKSVYDTTGYFYYSCFDNFAYLPEGSNDFRVYEQVGTPSSASNFFYQRGNFMPYNDLDPTRFRQNVYQGGAEEAPLNDAYPRKNEDLYYLKGTNNYFHGMIMETKFQQGPNGLAENGDPMVFEFNGDDDLWVYADKVLLLDIGGVHDAFHGKINFQTGKIHVDGQNSGDEDTYIKEQYWQAHLFPDGTEWKDRNDPKQDLFFTKSGEDSGNLNAQGQPKLKGTYLDYTAHDLKMFYMERGAGASNLEIQFNLPVLTGDEFRVTKNMLTTATGKPIQSEYSDAFFYYKAQIKQGNDWVDYKKTSFPSGKSAVYDDDEHTPVIWKDDTIFEVKPGQTAIIPVADSSVEYRVIEVEPEPGTSHMLDNFNVSNSDQDPTDSRQTLGKTVKRRSQVFFDNKPVDEIVNELRITKNLHGQLYKDPTTVSKLVEDQNGSPYFEIRIYLEATGGEMVPYSLGEYYQIDGQTGRYVYYDKGVRKLAEESVVDGVTYYTYTYTDTSKNATLTAPKITEHTSQNGSLGDFRPGDTIVIKGLLEGTEFAVDERTDRTHMTTTNEGNWNNKYYYSHTDVTGAMQRKSDGTPVEETKPDNFAVAGVLYDQPANASQINVSDKAARGTIRPDGNAEVTVHNEVYNQFSLPLQKIWSEDFDLGSMDENARVEFVLKRAKLADRAGTLTLKATETGFPAGYDPAYLFTNKETNETVTVYYSQMTGTQDPKTRTLTLPLGTYTVTLSGAPEGYDVDESISSDTVTVTSDGSATGATAVPDTITVTRNYTRQSGKIQFTKTLTGYHGNSSFENFKATYAVTDMAGRAVKNIHNQDVPSVTLTRDDFTKGTDWTKVIEFTDLPAGKYLVTETINSTSYDEKHYTVVTTQNPTDGVVTVRKDSPAALTGTSTYTEVKKDDPPVSILVREVSYGHNTILIDDSTNYHAGERVVISFMRQANNPFIKYRINSSSENDWVPIPPVGTGGNVVAEIHETVPEGGINLEIKDDWDWNRLPQSISLTREQTTSSASAGTRTMGAPGAVPRLQAAGAAPGPEAENNAPMPAPAKPSQMYVEDDNWSLTVSMGKDGKLYDKDGAEISGLTVTRENNTWSVELPGADFDGLVAEDENGNLYYYYIHALKEYSVPDGTKPSIDLEADGTKYLYSKQDREGATGRVLSAANELILAYGKVELTKVDENKEPLPGAEFMLYRSYSGGRLSGPLQDEDGAVVATSGPEGKITFTHVPAGTWYLKETHAPEGYRVSPAVYKVEITIKAGQEEAENPETETTVTLLTSGETVDTIPNTPVTYGTVEFDKRSTGGRALDGAVFTLFTDYDCQAPFTLAGSPVTATSQDGGKVIFTYTRTVKGETVTGLETGDYYMTETAAPAGFLAGEEKYFVHIGDGTEGDTSFIAPVSEEDAPAAGQSLEQFYRTKAVTAVRNTPVEITVKKTDEAGRPLSGAAFTLTRTGGESVTKPGDDPDTASYTFSELPDGDYTLAETRTPAGYSSVGNVTFRIRRGTIADIALTSGVTWDGETLTFTVKNTPAEDGTLTIRKQWLDYFGNGDTYDGTVNLTLRQWAAIPHKVNVVIQCEGDGAVDNHGDVEYSGQVYELGRRSETGFGDATFYWDWDQWTSDKPFDVYGLEGSTYDSTLSSDGKRRTVTVHNITKDLTLYVVIRNGGWKGTDDGLIGQVTFPGGGDPVPVATGGTRTVTLGEGGVWSRTFTLSGSGLLSNGSGDTLPKTYNGADCYYTISEDSVPAGYTLQQISADKADSGVLTAFNQKTSLDLTVRKVDKNDPEKLLPGAAFTLTELDPDTPGVHAKTGGRTDQATTSSGETDKGTLTFTGLTKGCYEIRETGVPAGYVISGEDAFYIRVDDTGVYMLEKDNTRSPSQWTATERYGSAGFQASNAVATVENEPGAELPSSGGQGTLWTYLMGAILVLLGGVLLLTRRRFAE